MTKKQLDILIVEDNQQYREVAKETLEKYGGRDRFNLNPQYVSTYQEAIDILNTKSIDAVISDLFFPFASEQGETMNMLSNVYDYFVQKAGSQTKRMQQTAWVEEISREMEYELPQLSKKYPQIDFQDAIKGAEILKNNKFKAEFPYGIGIALLCSEKKIPYTIVSQGERHHGELSQIRCAAMHSQKLKKVFGTDPLVEMLLYQGGNPSMYGRPRIAMNEFWSIRKNVDKSSEQTWIDALTHKTSKLSELMSMHCPEFLEIYSTRILR